jgi:hypothetical protein
MHRPYKDFGAVSSCLQGLIWSAVFGCSDTTLRFWWRVFLGGKVMNQDVLIDAVVESEE